LAAPARASGARVDEPQTLFRNQPQATLDPLQTTLRSAAILEVAVGSRSGSPGSSKPRWKYAESAETGGLEMV
jgi:hypothetical protein